ncbi:hypothetical protein FRC01_010775, partial [Tulasnella sp. 417]
EFIGLPKEWERTLQQNNRRGQESNRQAEAENLKFYQVTTGVPARIDITTGSTILHQANHAHSLSEGSQKPATETTPSDVPRGIIDHALDFVRNYPQQPYHHVKDAQESDQESEGLIHGKSDRALQEIDDEIDLMGSTIEGLLTSLRESLTARLIRRKKERNILVRLHQLPLEIASEILWLSIADPWNGRASYSFSQRLRTISSVCSSWRTVVESSPRFWSIIEITATPGVISTLLKNSKNHPLEIRCFSDGAYHWPPRMTRSLRGHWPLIVPHMQRIRSLIVEAYPTEGILTVLREPAPMLEELKLSCDLRLVQPIDVFGGKASRLRDVVIQNIPIRWDSGALEGLRSLQIKAIPEYSPTETELLRLLEANPGLEKLDIEDVRVMEDFGDGVWPAHSGRKRSRVIMGNLREMRLFNLPFELVRVILGNVEIPSIEHLDVNCLFRGHPASQLLGPNIQHLVPPIIQRSTGAEVAHLTIGEESVGFAVYLPHQTDPAIRIQLNNTAPVSGCGGFAESLFTAKGFPGVGAPDILPFKLKFGDNFDMQGGTFVPILDRLGAVEGRSLTIDSRCKHGEELIEYLGEMKEDGQWPLPHLTSLTVAGEAHTATHLLAALQARKQGVGLAEIAALEELNIVGLGVIDSNVEEDLDELMGPSGTFIRATRSWYSWRSSPAPSVVYYPAPSIYASSVSVID